MLWLQALLQRSTIQHTMAEYGGVLYVTGGIARIEQGTMSNTVATDKGGITYSSAGKAVLKELKIGRSRSGNRASTLAQVENSGSGDLALEIGVWC